MQRRVAFGKKLVESQVGYFVSRFGEVESEWKYDGSRVTEADLHLSSSFEKATLQAFPEDQFFSEELEHGDEAIPVKAGFSWLLDPIDGTNNFARGLPLCSISLALMKDGNPIYGYVYDHATRHLIHGGPGAGLFLDDRPAKRMESEITPQSLVASQTYDDPTADANDAALRSAFKIRALGSSALHMAYTAMGWLDGVVAHRIKAWDIAGGMPILAASGGSTRFFDTEVFPMKTFSSKAKGFGHIAGSEAFCDILESTMQRECAYRW